MFAGGIVESNLQGLDDGPLYELSLGGEGGVVGGAFTQSASTGRSTGFVFAGISLSAGPLAGGQLGTFLGPNEFGLYLEGHNGLTAGGVGFAFTSCPISAP